MSVKTVNRLNDKEELWELTDKQRVVVNALAEYPDKGPKEIAEIASGNLDGDTVSRSYVHPIKSKYGNLVEKQREIKENERYEGTERAEGNPFESLDETLSDDSKGWQTIQERPYTDETESIKLELSKSDVESLLSGDVPDDLKRELLARVVGKAFD